MLSPWQPSTRQLTAEPMNTVLGNVSLRCHQKEELQREGKKVSDTLEGTACPGPSFLHGTGQSKLDQLTESVQCFERWPLAVEGLN
jgi:hypothetical protein